MRFEMKTGIKHFIWAAIQRNSFVFHLKLKLKLKLDEESKHKQCPELEKFKWK